MLGQPLYRKNKVVSSPSRSYVAMMNRGNFDGYYFRTFTLPEGVDNDCGSAASYYMNYLDIFGCMNGCFPAENMADTAAVKDEDVAIGEKLWKENNQQTVV